MDNKYLQYYKDIVGRNKYKYLKVIINDKKIARIKQLVIAVINKKQLEPHHQIDKNKEFNRFYTGFLGEAAIEALLHTDKIIDWSCGNSNDYNVPDLLKIGINAGIKTADIYNFPVIFKKNTYPQIINIRYGYNTVFICGLATTNVLNTYQNDDLILSPFLRKRGTKTGFYGFDQLLSFNNGLKKLQQVCCNTIYPVNF